MRVALITEGATDQIVLKPIIEGMFQGEEVFFRALQPVVDHTDRQVDAGGWLLVMKALATLDVANVLLHNDLVIVQIDTDISHQKGFDVPHGAPGAKVDPHDLCKRVTEKLRSLLPMEETDTHHGRFLYAIGVHSIECWLIGLVDSKHHPNVIHGCLDKLNSALRKKNLRTISMDTKNKGASRKAYLELGRQLAKPKTLHQQSKLNAGFHAFFHQLIAQQQKIE